MNTKLYNGLVCNVHNTGDYISRVIRKTGIWEPNVTYWIQKLSDGGIFIDVGANIGYCSLVASKIYSKVYAFEPVPENYLLLEKSLEDNKITNVELIKKCVGNPEEGSLQLTSFLENMGGTRNTENTKKQNLSHMTVSSTRTYECIRLDELTDNLQTINLLKIDVEGHELQVLRGFSRGLLRKKCKHILLELSPCSLPNETCINILETLTANGYRLYDIGCCERGASIKSVGCNEILNSRSFVSKIHQTNILASCEQ